MRRIAPSSLTQPERLRKLCAGTASAAGTPTTSTHDTATTMPAHTPLVDLRSLVAGPRTCTSSRPPDVASIEGRRDAGRDEAVNYFLGVPGKPEPELELTYNFGVDAYELGTGYGHIALTVDDMDATLAALAEKGITPERPPYRIREGGSLLCFVRDPDG